MLTDRHKRHILRSFCATYKKTPGWKGKYDTERLKYAVDQLGYCFREVNKYILQKASRSENPQLYGWLL
jgi:hypothetical protein